ncbi:MAG: lysylphosphatidylglycerol synthase transmembrane domain-containing protein [Thermoanaerobaculia bacterium]
MTSPQSVPPPPAVSPEPTGPAAEQSRLRSVLKLLLVGMALFLVWRLASRVGWREVGERMAEVGPMPLLLSTLFLFGRYVAVNLRWSLALHRLGPQPHHLVRILMLFTAAFVNHITPAARVLGGILRARYLGRYQSHPFSELYGVVLADQVSHHLVHLVLTWLALVALAWQVGQQKTALIAGLALPALALVVTYAVHTRHSERWRPITDLARRMAKRQESRLSTLLEGGRGAYRRFREIFADRNLQFRMAIFGVAFFLLNVLAQWVIFSGLDSQVSLLTVAITVALGAAAGQLTGTPGGAATTEAAMIACFVALGVDRVDAVAATLLYRGLHYGLIMILGVPALLYFEFSNSKVKP